MRKRILYRQGNVRQIWTQFVSKRISSFRRFALIAPPFVFLLLFFVIPFLLILKISFADTQMTIPPFSPLFQWLDGNLNITVIFEKYAYLLTNEVYAFFYIRSIRLAFFATVGCLLIGYPVAYTVARSNESMRNILLLLLLLPSWTSLLIRIYAWMGILSPTGYLNNVLIWLGLIDTPLPTSNNNFSIFIGLIYSYLPLMILPLYANITKLDESLLEAAADLGCRGTSAFFRVILPLTLGGIISGSMLVFIPAVGEFVIPELLGGSGATFIGRMIFQEFSVARDWPLASAMAVVMMFLLLIPISIFIRQQNKQIS